MLYCRSTLQREAQRPAIRAVAERVRAKRSIPETGMRELLSKYQVMLDNQLYKALNALREAQAWRVKTIEGVRVPESAAL